MNIPVRRAGGVELAEDVVPRTTAAWARSRAAVRASGVSAMGVEIGCSVGGSEWLVGLEVEDGWDCDV